MERITQLWIDLFCGAGGTTTGIESATHQGFKFAKVIACVNHDEVAINTHYENHPSVKHFYEDIRTLDLTELIDHLEVMKLLYPQANVYLWASLECTNFSNAKGGLPRDADSRTLAEHLYRYIDAISPDFIYIENVREFMSWGPLDDNGKPVSKMKGCDYEKWKAEIEGMGYVYDYKLLNAADFGAYTSRLRYFGQFAKEDIAEYISWPKPTHSKKGVWPMEPYKAVREVLDLEDVGNSIFNRKKPLAENTLKRIYAGLKKYVGKDANTSEQFICCYYGGKLGANRSRNLESPLPTIVNRNIHSLVTPVVSPAFITVAYSGSPESKALSLDSPSGTITTIDHHQPVFISKYYSAGDSVSSLDKPCGTLTTKDRMALVSCKNGAFLFNPGWGGNHHSIDKPAPTIIASQHKIPLTVVNCKSGSQEPAYKSENCEVLNQIIDFCKEHNISDVSIRMLKVSELKVIQGFPSNYILKGSQADQKKFIGNSVCPKVAEQLAIANRMQKAYLMSFL